MLTGLRPDCAPCRDRRLHCFQGCAIWCCGLVVLHVVRCWHALAVPACHSSEPGCATTTRFVQVYAASNGRLLQQVGIQQAWHAASNTIVTDGMVQAAGLTARWAASMNGMRCIDVKHDRHEVHRCHCTAVVVFVNCDNERQLRGACSGALDLVRLTLGSEGEALSSSSAVPAAALQLASAQPLVLLANSVVGMSADGTRICSVPVSGVYTQQGCCGGVSVQQACATGGACLETSNRQLFLSCTNMSPLLSATACLACLCPQVTVLLQRLPEQQAFC